MTSVPLRHVAAPVLLISATALLAAYQTGLRPALVASSGASRSPRLATGSGLVALPQPKAPFFDITKYGAVSGGSAVTNQTAINDAIVLKGSFGLGRFLPTQNVLIEHCTVSGYDAGSVIDKVYSTQKRVATDRDGPTARIKLGTEGTTGFNTVTIRHVIFDRSRGSL